MSAAASSTTIGRGGDVDRADHELVAPASASRNVSGLRTLAVTLLCVALTSCGEAAFADDRRIAEGGALFRGAAPLTAHAAGDTDVLPGIASRCVNCHERRTVDAAGPAVSPATVAADAQTTGGAPSAAAYASALDAAWLTTAHVRHGGPPTRYDETSFCTVIRTGVDPATVMIPPVMPRYDVTDAQCASLWAFLGSR